MRTTTRSAVPATAAALVCSIALLAVAGCGTQPATAGAGPKGASPSASPSAPPSEPADPFAGKDPATVVKDAYQRTEEAAYVTLRVGLTVGARHLQGALTIDPEGSCGGDVTVFKSGTAELFSDGDALYVKGDAGFLEDQFEGRPQAVARASGHWVKAKADDPAFAHLTALCGAGFPASLFTERANVHRDAGTYSDGRRVAVFTSDGPGGVKITDHVLMDGTPYLLKRQQAGPDFARFEYSGMGTGGRPLSPPDGRDVVDAP
ncbi:hypothetical protein ACFWBI_24305 [Streptomyces sp. NPDC059982]|uniref:hypothetical protein n=1 Tax=unclassified Streptomyces TaxID=2593676 RepID=UPI00368EC245